MRKNYSSNKKNFWVFRIAGMLAALEGIRNEMITSGHSVKVQNFMTYLSNAGSYLREANEILREINHKDIVK